MPGGVDEPMAEKTYNSANKNCGLNAKFDKITI
jgi:hypothetical protein